MVGIKLCLLNLGLCNIASSVVFTLFFTGIPEELSSTVCGSNDGCSGWDEFLVKGVKITKLLVMVDGGVHSYGYLRWKFRLIALGLWSVRSVTMTVHFSVSALTKNGLLILRALGLFRFTSKLVGTVVMIILVHMEVRILPT
ncbi:hypothetical protein MKW98_024629 [Papaver atlanticum]|uniref:Uncharacterized protein n=1 Tax=Papaver atlanticum TaxID=357466 RepID=A0AAD4S2F4_9MAGN|nr:hypothetical protein MKW98_024629 [Papaver atlanticum]